MVQKTLEYDFQTILHSVARLWPLYPTGIKIGSKRPLHVLKHAEMQSEARGVQSFSAKSVTSSAKRAPNRAAGNYFESPDCLLSNAL